MDHFIPEDRNNDNNRTEDQHPGYVTDIQQPGHRLSGQHGAAGRKADIHDADQHQRHHRAIYAKLGAAEDHLGQSEPRPLQRMQGHHRRTQHLAQQKPDQRPHYIPAQHNGQRAGYYRRYLQVTAEPQGELAKRVPMPFVFGNVINRPRFTDSSIIAL